MFRSEPDRAKADAAKLSWPKPSPALSLVGPLCPGKHKHASGPEQRDLRCSHGATADRDSAAVPVA